MVKLYIRLLLISILFIIVLKVIDTFLYQDVLFDHVHDEVFDSEKEVDFLFFGNSLSQHSFNDKMIDSAFNSTSYSLGSSAQYFEITGELFKKSINQKAQDINKLMVVVVTPYQFKVVETEKWHYLQKAPLDYIPLNTDYLRIVNKLYAYNELPDVLFKSIRFHSEFSDQVKITNNDKKRFTDSDSRGFIYHSSHQLKYSDRVKLENFTEKVRSIDSEIKKSTPIQLDTVFEEYIETMVSLSKQNNIDLLFITPPAPNLIDPTEDYGYFKTFDSIFTSQKVPYLNLNKHYNDLDLSLDDFSDMSHLNVTGNKKLTTYMIKYFKDTFNLEPNTKGKIKAKPLTTALTYQGAIKDISIINSDIQKTEFLKDSIPVYKVSRTSVTKNSYFSFKPNIAVKENERHIASVVVKASEGQGLFGMRIQGTYPNRIDAVFNLDKGIIKGSVASGTFSQPKARIKDLGNGYYECIIDAIVSDPSVRVIMGSTSAMNNVNVWEAPVPQQTDVMILPESLTLSQVTD